MPIAHTTELFEQSIDCSDNVATLVSAVNRHFSELFMQAICEQVCRHNSLVIEVKHAFILRDLWAEAEKMKSVVFNVCKRPALAETCTARSIGYRAGSACG